MGKDLQFSMEIHEVRFGKKYQNVDKFFFVIRILNVFNK